MEGQFMTTVTPNNGTTGPSVAPYPVSVGYICAIVAVILFGSNFVPVKQFKTGDGMFFQWILCSGIFLTGLVVQLVRLSEFHPLIMAGGAIWATGNLCVVPIIKTIGLGLGLSIWGTIGLITGWASGRFGWFGIDRDSISNPALNYAGVSLAVVSILVYLLVKNEISSSTEVEVIVVEGDDDEPLIGNSNQQMDQKPNSKGGVGDEEEEERMFVEDLSPGKKKAVGIVLSVFSGFMYGINFAPSNYVEKDESHSSQNGLDYVFAQFCGIYLTSSVYFLLYCAVKKNNPQIYPKVILPGIVSGIMWAVATAGWFVANAELSQAISFPIVSAGPSAVAGLFWGVLVFHEIKGLRNILFLMVAFCFTVTGSVLAGMSK